MGDNVCSGAVYPGGTAVAGGQPGGLEALPRPKLQERHRRPRRQAAHRRKYSQVPGE